MRCAGAQVAGSKRTGGGRNGQSSPRASAAMPEGKGSLASVTRAMRSKPCPVCPPGWGRLREGVLAQVPKCHCHPDPYPSAPRPSEQAPPDAHGRRMCGVAGGQPGARVWSRGSADMRARRCRRGELALPRPVTVRRGSAIYGYASLDARARPAADQRQAPAPCNFKGGTRRRVRRWV